MRQQGKHMPRNARAPLASHLRQLLSTHTLSATDSENVALFLKSQRMYQVCSPLAILVENPDHHLCQTLLDRYNPLHDLTAEEHIKATAQRVGLDMPVRRDDSDSSSGSDSDK